jgi:hypothetical protein
MTSSDDEEMDADEEQPTDLTPAEVEKPVDIT